jgi:hypothetical protein
MGFGSISQPHAPCGPHGYDAARNMGSNLCPRKYELCSPIAFPINCAAAKTPQSKLLSVAGRQDANLD